VHRRRSAAPAEFPTGCFLTSFILSKKPDGHGRIFSLSAAAFSDVIEIHWLMGLYPTSQTVDFVGVHALNEFSRRQKAEATLDFDATNTPATVQSAFEEAIKCHAQSCFVSSAIIVRKTLDGLDDLRLLESHNRRPLETCH